MERYYETHSEDKEAMIRVLKYFNRSYIRFVFWGSLGCLLYDFIPQVFDASNCCIYIDGIFWLINIFILVVDICFIYVALEIGYEKTLKTNLEKQLNNS